jgi:hypothetical protein
LRGDLTADKRVIYFGKSLAIQANDLEAFTPSDVDELLECLNELPRLAEKVRRARDWEAPTDDGDVLEPVRDLAELSLEALAEESVLGPASDRDSARYWENLAREICNSIERDGVPVGDLRKLVDQALRGVLPADLKTVRDEVYYWADVAKKLCRLIQDAGSQR